MKDKQTTAHRTAGSRRNFMKAASVGAGLAFASGSTELLAASAGKEDTVCTLVPYFQVPEGKLEDFRALGPKFVKLTRKERGCVHYALLFNGQVAHCREGYVNAAAVLAHLKNVDAVLKEALAIAPISRLEVHGPAAELDKLREPLAGLSPQWFTLAQGGFRR
jgi:quinol monooxygenase YgiN